MLASAQLKQLEIVRLQSERANNNSARKLSLQQEVTAKAEAELERLRITKMDKMTEQDLERQHWEEMEELRNENQRLKKAIEQLRLQVTQVQLDTTTKEAALQQSLNDRMGLEEKVLKLKVQLAREGGRLDD